MKNLNYIVFVFFSTMLTNCTPNYTNETLTITETEKQNLNSLFEREDKSCLKINLIAGQNHLAVTVAVHVVGDNFIITYTTTEDWLLYSTHLSINNCKDNDFPMTSSENPKVGRFEYSTDNNEGVNQVVYTIEGVNEFEDRFCIAAHAEVVGPTGAESAWAEGERFPGKNWTIYFEGSILDCDLEDPDDETKK